MAIVPNWMQNRAYSARLDRQLISSQFYEGVRTVLAYAVSQRAAGANMSVDVAVGEAYVDGDDQPNQGSYFVENDAVVNVTVTAAPGANSRIDLVVLQVRDPNAGGPAGDDAVIQVIAGTAAATPVAPAVPASAIPLAQLTVAAGQASIATANITDRRPIAGRKAAAGMMELYSGPAQAVPNGWLVCDGTPQLRASYPVLSALYALGGYAYGPGDGTTTFGLPDLRAKVPIAAGTGFGTVGAAGGSASVTLTAANLPSHTHTIASHTHTMAHTHGIDHDHASVTSSVEPDHRHNVDPPSTNVSGGKGTLGEPSGWPADAVGGILFGNPMNYTPNMTRSPANWANVTLAVNIASFATDYQGEHSHTVNLPLTSGLNSEASSAANTGGTALTTAATGSGTAFNVVAPHQVITAWLVCVG